MEIGDDFVVFIEEELEVAFQRQSALERFLVINVHLTILANTIIEVSFENHVCVVLLLAENEPYLSVDHTVVEVALENELILFLSRHKDTRTMSEISLPGAMVLVDDALVVL